MKTLSYFGILAATLVLVGAGCKHADKRTTTLGGGEDVTFHSEKKGESIETKLLWVKNKPKAVDVNLQITNNYKKNVVLKIRNFKGEVGGEQVASFMPDQYIELQPGAVYNGTILMRLAPNKKRSGQAKITMNVSEGTASEEGKAMKPVVLEFPVKAVD